MTENYTFSQFGGLDSARPAYGICMADTGHLPPAALVAQALKLACDSTAYARISCSGHLLLTTYETDLYQTRQEEKGDDHQYPYSQSQAGANKYQRPMIRGLQNPRIEIVPVSLGSRAAIVDYVYLALFFFRQPPLGKRELMLILRQEWKFSRKKFRRIVSRAKTIVINFSFRAASGKIFSC